MHFDPKLAILQCPYYREFLRTTIEAEKGNINFLYYYLKKTVQTLVASSKISGEKSWETKELIVEDDHEVCKPKIFFNFEIPRPLSKWGSYTFSCIVYS